MRIVAGTWVGLPTLWGALLLATAGLPRPAPPPSCDYSPHSWTDPSPDLWADTLWQDGDETTPRSAAYVAGQLAGQYRLLAVQTEGSRARRFTQGALTLTGAVGPLLRPEEPTRVVLRGRLDSLGTSGRAAGAGVPVAPRRAPTPVVVYYDSTTQRLSLHLGGTGLDEGWDLAVYAIDSAGGLRGRWVDNVGYHVELATPVATLVEHPSGYFCAWRVPAR